MKSSLVYKTLIFSIILQLIAGVISAYAYFLPIQEKDSIYQELLGLDTVVQFIEAIFYVVFIYFYSSITNMATLRYYDWMITTPIMLFTTMALFKFQSMKDEKEKSSFSLTRFTQEHKSSLSIVLGLNALMLLFGYLGEIKQIPIIVATVLGFVCFGGSFYEMYRSFVTSSQYSYFLVFTLLWSLYGVAYLWSDSLKNTAYNILDIFSKNIYGLLLVWIVYKSHTQL